MILRSGVLRLVAAILCLAAGVFLSIRSAAIAEAQFGEPNLATTLGIPWPAAEVSAALSGSHDPSKVSPAAVRAAVDAARDQPLSGEPFMVLGVDLSQRDPARANRLVAAALLRDPRLTRALVWEEQQALSSNQPVAAARYAVRLLNLLPTDLVSAQLLAKLADLPETHPVILDALSRTPDWANSLLATMTKGGTDRAFIFQAMAVGSPVEVNRRGQREMFLNALLANGEFERAYVAWISWLPKESLSAVDYLYDGKFVGQPGTPPFNWEFEHQPSATADTASDGLEVVFDGSADVSLAHQTIVLPPGKYRLRSAIQDQNGQQLGAVPSLYWRVVCMPKNVEVTQLPLPLDHVARVASQPFEIGTDCPAQLVELHNKAVAFPARVSATLQYVKIEAVQ